MPMSPRLLRPRASGLVLPSDADARAYVLAVNTADGQPLEAPVVQAIDAFVIGCKADGIWSAIKASCILMGARTLSGALTPLVGSAPTNNGPFVSADYNRKTGLIGNGTTKYLNSNRASNADPTNNQHQAVYATTAATSTGSTFPCYIGVGGGDSDATVFFRDANNGPLTFRHRSSSAVAGGAGSGSATGLIGMSRASSSSVSTRISGVTASNGNSSEAVSSRNTFVFATHSIIASVGTVPSGTFSNARLAFYSIGESLTLSLLDSRVTTLYNAIGAAIP